LKWSHYCNPLAPSAQNPSFMHNGPSFLQTHLAVVLSLAVHLSAAESAVAELAVGLAAVEVEGELVVQP
jgi:hypothetical protein